MEYNTVKIIPTQAEDTLFELYNIKGKATALPGDVDFNFKIKTDKGELYILKISRPDTDETDLAFQQGLLQFLEKQEGDITVPKVILDKNGSSLTATIDSLGNKRCVRLLSWVSGRIWSSINPQSDDLRYSLGAQCGFLTQVLQKFDHQQAHRSFEWDIAHSLWTREQLHLFTPEERTIVSSFQDQFEASQKSYSSLRKSVIHNDANDNNIIVSPDLTQPEVIGLIDYGDAIHTQIISDVAIACAYAVMHHNDPLDAALSIIKGYHSTFPLQEQELKHLYIAIAMRLTISVTKSAINKRREPDNAYLLVSEKPAWEVLRKWHTIHPDFAHYSFRAACGFTAHPNQRPFEEWAATHHFQLTDLFPTIQRNDVHHLDLSVSSTWIGHQQDFNNLDAFQFKIEQLQKQVPDKLIAGGYLEPRPIYTSTSYDKIGNKGRESRSVHLGIDYWLPTQTSVHALFDGEVVIAVHDKGNKEYGGLVVLKHQEDTLTFYTLYGHLTVASALQHKLGDRIIKGECVAHLADYPENGNWAPHLHFQLMLSLFDYTVDFPGVTYHSQLSVWKSVCPDPNLLFKLEALREVTTPSNDALIDYRKQHLGKSLSLHYETPIKMVRGSGQYLIDQNGRKYLDTVNNVAHVGHEHYDVVKAGQEQLALLNTNSRYLHDRINTLAEELIATLPPELSVLHFVNSGSEANELAIRMAKAHTGERDMIVSEAGYHGNTNACVDISSYKFDGKGGNGAPEHSWVIHLPDTFRGKYREADAGSKYAKEVQHQIDAIHKKGRGIAAFIIEPIISCGGQIELPEGFLAKAYQYTRKAGGLCIADEVQTGCGRVGKAFWGFQLHNVIPDIVTIGKPLGNGHPIAAVACTRKVADRFANGMEYFNTFGGNPVSCAIATEVLRVVKREGLQQQALKTGDYLKEELNTLAKEFSIIGDVRGQGLFLGVELVDAQRNPLKTQASYLANRMKDFGILMSTDGPDGNVLKIKPPLVFTKENAQELVFYMRKILAEDIMQIV